LKKDLLQSTIGPCDHIRLYTFKTLRRHLEYYGFKVFYSTSYPMGYVESNLAIRLTSYLALEKRWAQACSS